MAFKDLLAKSIEESKMTVKEISLKCEKEGMKITDSYISQLRSGKQKSPSEQIVRTLAKVLNVEPKLMLIETYLDNTPELIKDFIKTKKLYEVDLMTLILNRNNLDKFENIKEILDEIGSISLSAYILEIINSFEEISAKGGIEFLKDSLINNGLKELNIQIQDDSMEPKIPKESSIIISTDEEVRDKDIVLVTLPDGTTHIRNIYFKEDEVILTANNSKYEPFKYKNIDEIKINGKVKEIKISL